MGEDEDEGEDLELAITSMSQFRQEAGKRIAEAVASRSVALAKEQKETGFPESEAEQQKCVKMLVAAITNTIEIEDKPCRNGRASKVCSSLFHQLRHCHGTHRNHHGS